MNGRREGRRGRKVEEGKRREGLPNNDILTKYIHFQLLL